MALHKRLCVNYYYVHRILSYDASIIRLKSILKQKKKEKKSSIENEFKNMQNRN